MASITILCTLVGLIFACSLEPGQASGSISCSNSQVRLREQLELGREIAVRIKQFCDDGRSSYYLYISFFLMQSIFAPASKVLNSTDVDNVHNTLESLINFMQMQRILTTSMRADDNRATAIRVIFQAIADNTCAWVSNLISQIIS